MEKDYLTLKRASASRPSGEWDDDDYDVFADGAVVGRIFNSHAGPVGFVRRQPGLTAIRARKRIVEFVHGGPRQPITSEHVTL